jgi:hypothetical protein
MSQARTGGTCSILRRMAWVQRTWASRTVVKAVTKQASRHIFWKVREYKRPIPVTEGLRRGSKAARSLGLRFESRRGNGCLSLVSVVCCQRSLRRANHSSRGVLPSVACLNECDRAASTTRRRWRTKSCYTMGRRRLPRREYKKIH